MDGPTRIHTWTAMITLTGLRKGDKEFREEWRAVGPRHVGGIGGKMEGGGEQIHCTYCEILKE